MANNETFRKNYNRFGVFNPSEKAKLKYKLIEKYGKTCYICSKEIGEAEFTIDHVIPFSILKSNVKDNLRPCCDKCNKKKRSEIYQEFGHLYMDILIANLQKNMSEKLYQTVISSMVYGKTVFGV